MEKTRDKNKRKRVNKVLRNLDLSYIPSLVDFGLVNRHHKDWVIQEINEILKKHL